MGISIPKGASRCVEHFDFETFVQESFQTLKLARAAVVYFVQMVLIREKRIAGEVNRISMRLIVPSHKYIRGHDGENLTSGCCRTHLRCRHGAPQSQALHGNGYQRLAC